MYGVHCCQDFGNSKCKFMSIVIKTPKLVLCFSCHSVSLKLYKKKRRGKTVRRYGLDELIFNPLTSRQTVPLTYVTVDIPA
jgi:hypothetical protein